MIRHVLTCAQHCVITALDACLEWAGAALLALDELTEDV